MINFDVAQLESNLPGEDRFQVFQKNGINIFGVFDGHGGFLAVDVVVSCLLAAIFENIDSLTRPLRSNEVVTAIDAAFTTVDQIILSVAQAIQSEVSNSISFSSSSSSSKNKPPGFAGSCVVVLVVVDSILYLAHVGDCRAILLEETSSYIRKPLSSVHSDADTASTAPISSLPPTPSNNSGIPGVIHTVTDKSSTHSDIKMLLHAKRKKSICNGYAGHFFDSLLNTVDFALGTIVSTDTQLVACGAPSFVEISNKNSRHDVTGENEVSSTNAVAMNSIHKCSGNVNHSSSSSAATPIRSFNSDSHDMATITRKYKRKSESLQLHLANEQLTFVLRGMTVDHNCKSKAELRMVKRLSSDPIPIKSFGSYQRVAGSLAITRAMGDGYLKIKELSLFPMKEHVPYITSRPTISFRPIESSDTAIILSSDGLWDYLRPDICLEIVAPLVWNYSRTVVPMTSVSPLQSQLSTASVQEDSYMAVRQNEIHQEQTSLWNSSIGLINNKIGLPSTVLGKGSQTHGIAHFQVSSHLSDFVPSVHAMMTRSHSSSQSNKIVVQPSTVPHSIDIVVADQHISDSNYDTHSSQNRSKKGLQLDLDLKEESPGKKLKTSSPSAENNNQATNFLHSSDTNARDGESICPSENTNGHSTNSAVINNDLIQKHKQHFMRNLDLVDNDGTHGLLSFSSHSCVDGHNSSSHHGHISLELLKRCVSMAASQNSTIDIPCTTTDLLHMAQGKLRRDILDDVTVMVITLTPYT